MGSKLRGELKLPTFCEELEVWPAIPLLAAPFDLHLNALALNSDGYETAGECGAARASGVLYEIDLGLKRIDYYTTLVSNLAKHGYDVEPCAYDWRRFLAGDRKYDLPQAVDQCVQAALARTGAGQVDIVAHSLGGLAARAYLLSHSTRAAKVHTVVSLGTPYLGSPSSLLPLRYGQSGQWVMDRLIFDPTLRNLAQNWPALYQILPSAAFFEYYPGGYFLSAYQMYADYSSMQHLLHGTYNPDLVDAAETLHANRMDNWVGDGLDVEYCVFVGTDVDTPCGIIEVPVWLFGQLPELRHTEVFCPGAGDGTVLKWSADLGGITSGRSAEATICYFPDVDHGGLTRDGTVFEHLNDALLGRPADEVYCPPRTADMAQSISDSGSVDSGRQLTVQGRALVHILDAEGRHAGPRPDGLVENNIPHVQYHPNDTQTFVALPPTGVYTITLALTNTVPIEVQFWTTLPSVTWDKAISETVIFQGVPSSFGGQATIVYDPLADPDNLQLEVDLDSDGTVDHTLAPSAVLDSTDSADHDPPISSITVEGARGPLGFYTGSVTVTLSAIDIGSGIYSIEYSLDGGQTGRIYTAPFTVEAEDVPVLYVQAVDRAGNREYPWVKRQLQPMTVYLPLIIRETP